MKRRIYLSGISVGLATAVAGCSEIFDKNKSDQDNTTLPYNFEEPTYLRVNESLELSDFDFPQGFSEQGLESFENTLGTNSLFYNSTDSFQVSMETYTQTQFTNSESSTTRYISDEQLRSLWERNTPRTIEVDVFTEYSHFNKLEQVGADTTKTRDSSGYIKEEQYLSLFRQFIEDIDFELKGLVTENVAYYTSSTSLNQVEKFGITNFTKGRIDLLVRENGLPYAIYIEIHEASESRQFIIEFSGFNNVFVGIPKWAQELQEN